MKVCKLGEFGLIKRIFEIFGDNALSQDIGDDAIQLPLADRGKLISVDSFIEGVHFKANWRREEKLGRKALLAACSDIVAMGGYVTHFFLSLVIPFYLKSTFLFSFLRGMKEFALENKLLLAGGNIASGQSFGVHITVIGLPFANRPIYRSGAKIGDSILITGELGGSLAGYYLLEKKYIWQEKTVSNKLIDKFLYPSFRNKEAKFLAESGQVNAMIDVSDGLYADLKHLIEASSVGARLNHENIPLYDNVKKLCIANALSPVKLAFASGEEYELLFTVNNEAVASLLYEASKRGLKFTPIGEIIPEKKIYPPITQEPKGFTHF